MRDMRVIDITDRGRREVILRVRVSVRRTTVTVGHFQSGDDCGSSCQGSSCDHRGGEQHYRLSLSVMEMIDEPVIGCGASRGDFFETKESTRQ